jgi:hypothetical protein
MKKNSKIILTIVIIIILIILGLGIAYYLTRNNEVDSYYITENNERKEINSFPLELINIKYIQLTGNKIRELNKDNKLYFNIENITPKIIENIKPKISEIPDNYFYKREEKFDLLKLYYSD